MSLLDDIVALTTAVAQLPEPLMRRCAINNFLESLPDDDAAWALGQILRRALRTPSPDTRDTLLATCEWILDLHSRRLARILSGEVLKEGSYLERLKKSAKDQGLKGVTYWVSTAGPEKMLAIGAKLPPINILPDGRPGNRDDVGEGKRTEVTVGHRRTLARRRDSRLLSYLMMDPDPLVLRVVLTNPMLRPADVISVASRRPTTPELLQEVALSPRWLLLEEVREALVLNPYASTYIPLSLLPSLRPTTRRRVANSQELHHMVGRLCALLSDLEGDLPTG